MAWSRRPERAIAVAAATLTFVACTPTSPQTLRVVASPEPAVASTAALATEAPGPSPAPVRAAGPTAAPSPVPDTPGLRGETITITYRVEVRVHDGEDFAPMLAAAMADPRGWVRAGYIVREDPSAPNVVVLAEGPEVDALCHPYRTGGTVSCQNGPVVAINADRWRSAVPHWPAGDLHGYRLMLLNHEMGHLLGQRHVDCPGPGRPAPVMQQQTGSLQGCVANSWPLDNEIEIAARHDQPIAPGYGE